VIDEEHTLPDCTDVGTKYSTGSTCFPGPNLVPNYFKVNCTCIQ